MQQQTQAEFDAFGWNPIRGLDPAEAYGLDLESARDATPRWFAVSFGNGNDGVSHTFPDYYVRTCEPFHLAAVAMLANFNNAGPEDKARIIDATQIDGESDYTISACIYNPEDIEPEDESTPDYESIAVAAGFDVIEHTDSTFVYVKRGELGDSASYADEDSAWQAACEDNELIPDPEDEGSYCDANGCWIQCDVFPVDSDSFDPEPLESRSPLSWLGNKPAYSSMADAFEPEDLRLTAE